MSEQSQPEGPLHRRYSVEGLSAVQYAVLKDLVMDQVRTAKSCGWEKSINGRPVRVLNAIAKRFKD